MGRDHDSHGPTLSQRLGLLREEILALRSIGETPHLISAEPPRPGIEAIRIVDMNSSNSWAEFSALFRRVMHFWIMKRQSPASSIRMSVTAKDRRDGRAMDMLVEARRASTRGCSVLISRLPYVKAAERN